MSSQTSGYRKSKVFDRAFHTFNYLFFLLYALICIYPFYFIILVSISDSTAVSRGDVFLWPVQINYRYYQEVFALKGILTSFYISLSRTVLGTLLSLFLTAMLAYVLTKSEFRFKKSFYRLTVATMYLNTGLIPYVVTMTKLGLRNNFLVYILPGAIFAFGLVLIKTYIEQLPAAIEESAIVDGAGYFTIFSKIIIPLCKPVIAAVGVFIAVGQWNTFTDNLFLVSNPNLRTMQLMLYTYLNGAQTMAASINEFNSMMTANRLSPPSPFTIKATLAVLTTIPIILAYPFLQRYFVKGIMLGAVKG